MLNKRASVVSELKKALTAAGEPELIPYDLESTLYEELQKLQPLTALLDFGQAEGLTHEFNVRTSHPQGWFEGETTGANNKAGTYARKSVALKIARIWGSVTGFAQTVDERFINALAEEMAGSVQGMADLVEYGTLYGAAGDIGFTGDAYQFSGILPRVFSYAPANVIDAGGDKIALADLDNALAAVFKNRQTRNDPGLWMMGLQMKQVVDGLQTKVQLPLTSVELADGKIEMAAYGNKPIYETDYLVPESTSTSPACSAVIASGGAIADGCYNYKISSVTMYGEQVAGSASADVVAATTNKKANLTWTHDDNAVLYLIWRQLETGGYRLLDIIPALTYDADGKVNGTVEAYSDLGAKTPVSTVKPLATGEQQILLFDTVPGRGPSYIGKIDDMGRQIGNAMSFVELARVKDTFDYMIKSYFALKMPYPNLAAVIRHAKLA